MLQLGAVLLLGACASNDPSGGGDKPPTIAISGVFESAIYDSLVAVGITIDRGAFEATLDGRPFRSGDTVRTPGAHTLSVRAHLGLAVSTRDVHFSIRAPEGGALIIRMLNLGSNDAGGGGDAGPAGANANDPGFVSRQLTALHVDTLALLVLTHAHGDHYEGMPAVLSAIKIRRFVYNGQVRTLPSYNSVVSQARAVADSVIVVSALRDYDLGVSAQPAHLKLFPPLATHLGATTDDGTELNDGSVGARLQLGTFTMLFTGDGEVAANNHWRNTFSDLIRNMSVLKVGHHGANNGIFDNGFNGASTWLDLVAPGISIISANGTSHPRINALTRLLAQPNNRTYCTNVHGNIELRVARSGTFTVTVQRNNDKDCVPGTDATT